VSEADRRILPFNALAKHLQQQVRGNTNPATVNRYRLAMKNGDVFPPITVADIHGSLVLVDGFHRCAAYEALGEWQTECDVVPCESLEQALWMAFNANMHHGQPLKASAVRPAFRAYVKAGNNIGKDGALQSYRSLARTISSASHSAIRRWMEKDFPEVFAVMAGGMDQAEGGLRPSHKEQPDAPYDLTMKASGLLDDALALMEGVDVPELRKRVVQQARMLAIKLELTGAGATDGAADDVGF
jgi:hypothetical protein